MENNISILQKTVANYARYWLKHNPLAIQAKNGKLSIPEYRRFLGNIHYLIGHTSYHLKLAEKSARDKNELGLADFFVNKQGEEIGHDQWALQDIKKLEQHFKLKAPQIFNNDARQLLSYIEACIDKNPFDYMTYIFFAEYATVLIVPEWVAALTKKCEIPSTCLTVFTRHADLDKEHVQQDLHLMANYFPDKYQQSTITNTLTEIMALHFDFCSMAVNHE